MASIVARDARPQEDDKASATEPAEPVDLDAGAPAPLIDAAGPSAAPADPAARDAWLVSEASSVVHRHAELAKARVGVAFIDAISGKVLWGLDASGRYNLASCTKVLTSSAALARLGPGFRWRTAIYAEKLDVATGVVDGDLYVRGRGDPTLDDAALRELAVDLRRAGVKRVTGKLVVDDSYFDDAFDPPHYADQPKEQSGYRAAVSAFGVDANAVTVVIEPDPAGIAPRRDPPRARRRRLRAHQGGQRPDRHGGARPRARRRDDHRRSRRAHDHRPGPRRRRRRSHAAAHRGSIALRGRGAARRARGGRHLDRPSRRPRRGAGDRALDHRARLARARRGRARDEQVLEQLLRGEHLEDDGRGGEAAAARAHAAPTSPAPKIQLAGPEGPHATWADGTAVVHDFLVHEVGLADGSFRVDNGSGLYGASDVSPLALATVVAHAESDFRYGPDFVASLATAGVDGTLRKRFANTPDAGRVRAKTGTLAAVSTLGGLVAVDGRRPIAFAILVNDIPDGGRAHARALEDELLTVALAYLRP